MPAQYEGIGHNYYVGSLTLNNTPYTNDYSQDVPTLGHDYSGNATFNAEESIYEKVCNRDGCDALLGYYAISDGSVGSRYEDEVTKVPFMCLNDGFAYDSKAEYTVQGQC